MSNVKQKIAWLWQNAEKVLIVIFFLTFTLNIRKVFLTSYSFLNGGFNEYMTLSFSWADLLMLTIIAIYTIKRILRQVINPYYASPGQEKPFNNVSRETFYLVIFLGWVGLSIFWSQYRPIAIYRFLTLAEIVLFAAIAAKCLKNSNWLKMTLFALVLSGLFQSLLGIAQFIHNASLGFRFLGESIIGPNIDGVAKILINGEKHIRAYGTFPHPNILAGFLIIPLFITIAELVGRIFPSLTRGKVSGKEMKADERSVQVSHETILGFIPKNFLWFLFSIIGAGFLLTFSRSAFLGLFLGLLIYVLLIAWNRNLVREIKYSFKIPASFFVLLILIIIIFLSTTSFFSSQSLQERQLYQHVSYETISRHPITGVGMGQFVLNEYKINPRLESWQYQPVHNIYLLVFSELGVVGLVFFLFWIFSIFLEWGSGENRNTDLLRSLLLTRLSIYCIIFSFLVISLFDHYFWDIKLGLLIFALPLIIYYGAIQQKIKLDKKLSSAIIKKY